MKNTNQYLTRNPQWEPKTKWTLTNVTYTNHPMNEHSYAITVTQQVIQRNFCNHHKENTFTQWCNHNEPCNTPLPTDRNAKLKERKWITVHLKQHQKQVGYYIFWGANQSRTQHREYTNEYLEEHNEIDCICKSRKAH